MNGLVAFLLSLGEKGEHGSHRSIIGSFASPGTLRPPHQLQLSRSTVSRGCRLKTEPSPHALVQLGNGSSTDGDVITVGHGGQVRSDPKDSAPLFRAAICYGIPEGPGP